ncbi:MAG: M20 family metallopeptidase [Trueperaceae bacterium]|nr:MAG: M20 family metallopeptidase [Trueperaceae bacterium]
MAESALEQLLRDLVRIPSPNPPGDCRDIARYIASWLDVPGVEIRTLHPPEKVMAESVIATLGDGSPPVIMLHAHIDTVPVAADEAERWSRNPFEPWVADEAIYGKGSVDDKGVLAAMMMAFRDLAQEAGALAGTVVLVGAAEEETGGQLGTRWLAESGHLPPCDFIVVGEQTANRVAVAHKGVLRATVRTRGRSVHATNPDRGVNAITAMAKLVSALEVYHRELRGRKHPLVGNPSCNVGTIQGGSTANAVPDTCEVRLDRRMVPREDPDVVKEELEAVVRSVDVSPATAEIGEFLVSSWFESDLATPLGQTFLRLAGEVGEAGPVGYLPGSDAKHLMGVARGDMVVFGPGSYEEAHAADEHVSLPELRDCQGVLSRFLKVVLSA